MRLAWQKESSYMHSWSSMICSHDGVNSTDHEISWGMSSVIEWGWSSAGHINTTNEYTSLANQVISRVGTNCTVCIHISSMRGRSLYEDRFPLFFKLEVVLYINRFCNLYLILTIKEHLLTLVIIVVLMKLNKYKTLIDRPFWSAILIGHFLFRSRWLNFNIYLVFNLTSIVYSRYISILTTMNRN